MTHHRTDVPLLQQQQQHVNNWIPTSLCSAMVNWNASALASVQSMTSAQLPGMLTNGLSRLPDLSSMFNSAHHVPAPSGVTINEAGSEVMFVVGADRRVTSMPSMKMGDVVQLDQSIGGLLGGEAGVLLPPHSRSIDVTGAGRVATVRPLEHTKQIRVNTRCEVIVSQPMIRRSLNQRPVVGIENRFTIFSLYGWCL